MLFEMAVISMLVLRVAGVEMVNMEAVETSDYPALAQAIVWMVEHLGWGMLIFTAFMILPTWLLFRYAPRHTRHTLPEGIYIQLFMSTLVLLFFVLARAFTDRLLWLVPLYYYFAFRQLFGYSIWGTLWRTALTWSISYILAIILSLEVMFILGHIPHDEESVNAYTVGTAGLLVICLVVLFVGYWIGKRKEAKRIG